MSITQVSVFFLSLAYSYFSSRSLELSPLKSQRVQGKSNKFYQTNKSGLPSPKSYYVKTSE